jgi:hypothetical protein
MTASRILAPRIARQKWLTSNTQKAKNRFPGTPDKEYPHAFSLSCSAILKPPQATGFGPEVDHLSGMEVNRIRRGRSAPRTGIL